MNPPPPQNYSCATVKEPWLIAVVKMKHYSLMSLLFCTQWNKEEEKKRKRKNYTLARGGGGVLPYKRLIGMCRWMGSHFHDWSDYNGVAFSIDLLEWGRKFSDFGGKKGFKMGRFSDKKAESCCLLNLSISSHWPHYIPALETTLIE